ncbi:hypothetical protein Hypma_010529 [Hypsizygus marmoreus]|uniref:JmjC domain-containing protein n=1 Tax=Hypsizygus marmoreus TaxID=39966 RepID=A0A369JM00_HYPMA|nr:hypothetical protein Hypma_010529 [Hypsizygus marmoreus]
MFVHMDKCSAINIMLHSKDMRHRMGAHWDIWSKADIAHLSMALAPNTPSDQCSISQPIIQKKFYAGRALLEDEYSKTGQHHWSFEQLPGEAVIIPLGCPHQVSNRGQCVKIACNFISHSHISVLEDMEVSIQKMNFDLKWHMHTDLL